MVPPGLRPRGLRWLQQNCYRATGPVPMHDLIREHARVLTGRADPGEDRRSYRAAADYTSMPPPRPGPLAVQAHAAPTRQLALRLP
jgi:hypothetical protein